MKYDIRVNCEEFTARLDQYLDGALDQAEAAAMRAHADICADCADKLRLSELIITHMRGMDDGVVAPPSARVAWRRAIKAEASRKKRRGYARLVAGIAAACVVMCGTTVYFRQSGMLSARPQAAIDYVSPTYALSKDSTRRIASGAPDGYDISYDNTAETLFMQTDGETENDTGNSRARISGDQAAAGDPEFVVVPDSAPIKRVNSAERVVETSAFDQEKQVLSDLAEEYGGYIASEAIDLSGKLRVAECIIRVPAEEFEAFMGALDNVGKLVASTKLTQDVSEYYYDAQSRLDSERLIIERLNALILSASGEELESLNAQLEQAYTQADDLERLIRAYDSDVRFSQIKLTLNETVPVPVATPEPSLGERSSSGFKQSLSSIGKFFGDMVVSMSIIAPAAGVLIALALIIGGVALIIKKNRGKSSASHEAREGINENA